MADGGQILLRQKAPAGAAPVEPPISPARLLRRAVARAGTGLGVALSAIGVEDGGTTLDEVIAALDDRQLILALERGGEAAGLAILDLDLRDVLVETQTLGHVQPRPAGRGPGRPVTRADAALAQPLIEAILGELRAGGPGTDLPLWAKGVTVGARLPTARDVGASLRAGAYRQVRLSLDTGAPDRQCALTLLLPAAGSDLAAGTPGDDARWSAALSEAVMGAPAALHAVLARVRLSLAVVERLAVGQVLPLPGITVGSVVVESADRAPLGTARLGQVAGLRAVRLELPAAPRLGPGLSRKVGPPGDAMLVDVPGLPAAGSDPNGWFATAQVSAEDASAPLPGPSWPDDPAAAPDLVADLDPADLPTLPDVGWAKDPEDDTEI